MSTYKVPGISEQKLIYPNHPVDWIIHLVKNGNICEESGEVEMGLLPNACNAHTHGMERYNHLNFQLVLNYSNEEIMRILNTLGCMVRDGLRFEDGDLIEGIYYYKTYENCGISAVDMKKEDLESAEMKSYELNRKQSIKFLN